MKAIDKMPRKKKGGQSPARIPSGLLEEEANTDYRLPPMASNLIHGSSLPTSTKQDIVRNMQEMFSHLDPEVIYIVLSECDFKVENAMDSLLELSGAATADPPPISTAESGFERTAAALLSPHRFAKPNSQTHKSAQLQCSSTSPTNFMTEDLDFLVDQEVLSLKAEQNVEKQQLDNKSLTPECSVSNLGTQCSGISIENLPSLQSLQRSEALSPLDELSTFESNEMQFSVVDDLPSETPVDKSSPSTDGFTPTSNSNTDAFSLSSFSNENMDSSVPTTWNTQAPAFYPQQSPAFITPVASNWPRNPRPDLPWHRPVGQAQPRPSTPMSCARPPPQLLGPCRLRLEGKVLVLLRGPPGSGKSTLARALLEENPGGVILSTDDYFTVNGQYNFNPTVLGEAHSWNHNRAKLAFQQGANPIIIDNTNMQGWEMKPYVVQALKHHYKVLFREPDTWWKNKPRELERHTKHGVPAERIRRMLCGYERFVTIKSILGSQIPEWKQVAAEPGEKLENYQQDQVPCPDILAESCAKKSQPHTKAAPSPDVSTTNDSDYYSDKQKNTDIDMGDLDSELDNLVVLGETFADSPMESVINKDHGLDEIPVAFSESIGQRLKRDRTSKKFGLELANKPEDVSKCEEKAISQQKEIPDEDAANSEDAKRLDFEGEWPSAASLDQRLGRRHKRRNDIDSSLEKGMDDILATNNQRAKIEDVPNPDLTEFQKLLDLIQTGPDPICVDYPSLSSISPCSEDELDISLDPPQDKDLNKVITAELPDCVFNSEPVGLTLVRENDPDMKDTTSCGQVCESPECEPFGETDSSQSGDMSGSQEHKQPQARRSGKQCKIAMTFTQASLDSTQSYAAAQLNDCPRLELKSGSPTCTDVNIYKNVKEEPEALPSSYTQTESQDFALLWRVNENSLIASESSSSDLIILCSDPVRFAPCATVAVNQSSCKEIPYSVVHDKSTQVEEEALGPTQDVLENLLILRCHFKRVALDTLEDLYEKCHRDLEWTTNLLLDSGERFFRDDESDEEEDGSGTGGEDEQAANDRSSFDMISTLEFQELVGSRPDVLVEEIEYSNDTASEPCTNIDTNNCDSAVASSILDGISLPQEKTHENINVTLQLIKENRANLTPDNTQVGVTLPCVGEKCEEGVYSDRIAGAEKAEGLVQTVDDIRSINEVHRLLQAELEELEREEKDREEEKARMKNAKQKKKQLFDIKSVELKLPTELALQLTELFGPVGVDPDTGSPEDYVLQMDLNLAKLLHQKWKEGVQERQKQAALSYRLLQESSSHRDRSEPRAVAGSSPRRFQMSSGRIPHLDIDPDAESHLPFMDHWSVSQPHVSLRDIIKEELTLQENRNKVRQSRADLNKRDGATPLKEEQLFALFPTIDRHFLQDIFRDHNYSLNQSQLFLHSLLDEGPVTTVVAPEVPHFPHLRAASKDRDKMPVEPAMSSYQDTEDPEYQDFRAEANLQRKRQLESFAKAAEAYKQGHKEVASFYAQQGHLHGQRMREANHRAAAQIFQRVNSSLLPRNILDLHGLHVQEALEHLRDVLETKTKECERGLCRPQLSVITGRGNHSQGGVARIRPAVLDYLTNKQYRFTEPKPGIVLVSLK